MEKASEIIANAQRPLSSANGLTSSPNPKHPYPDERTVYAFDVHYAEMLGKPPPQTCPKCRGTGVMVRDDGVYPLHTKLEDIRIACPVCSIDRRKQWIANHCGMEDAAERVLRLHHWKVPQGTPVQQQQRQDAYQMMLEAIEHQAGLYTYWGDFGAGKTMAIQIVVNELRESSTVEGFYAPFAVVLEHLRRLYATGKEASEFWHRLLTIPVLALDEVTRFRQENEWQQHQLFMLVDTRYRRRKSHLTLFATNDDPRKNLLAEDKNNEIGYLFSRMREGRLIELRGDVRRRI